MNSSVAQILLTRYVSHLFHVEVLQIGLTGQAGQIGLAAHSVHKAHVRHRFEAGELGRVSLHELDGVLVGQVLEGLDDFRIAVLILSQQTGFDVFRVYVFVIVTHPGKGIKIIS